MKVKMDFRELGCEYERWMEVSQGFQGARL
jgi:hypothetical protein